MENSELIMSAINGDVRAFGKLYSVFSDELYRYAYFILGSGEYAMDAVQDAVCSAFQQIGNLRKPSSFKPWLFKILSVSCKKYINELARERMSTEFVELNFADMSFSEYDLSPEISAALSKLTPEERSVIILHTLHGYKSREIAEILDMTSSGVRSKLARSLEKMKNSLESEEVSV